MSSYYRKILVPVDGSIHADMACRHAAGIAKCGGGALVLLHCYGELPAIIGGEAREEIIATCEFEAKQILAAFEQHCKENEVPYTTLIRAGRPGRTIVQVCKEEYCDLIVMGSRGLSDFSGMVMGSVSHRVLTHSPVPVMVVR